MITVSKVQLYTCLLHPPSSTPSSSSASKGVPPGSEFGVSGIAASRVPHIPARTLNASRVLLSLDAGPVVVNLIEEEEKEQLQLAVPASRPSALSVAAALAATPISPRGPLTTRRGPSASILVHSAPGESVMQATTPYPPGSPRPPLVPAAVAVAQTPAPPASQPPASAQPHPPLPQATPAPPTAPAPASTALALEALGATHTPTRAGELYSPGFRLRAMPSPNAPDPLRPSSLAASSSVYIDLDADSPKTRPKSNTIVSRSPEPNAVEMASARGVPQGLFSVPLTPAPSSEPALPPPLSLVSPAAGPASVQIEAKTPQPLTVTHKQVASSAVLGPASPLPSPSPAASVSTPAAVTATSAVPPHRPSALWSASGQRYCVHTRSTVTARVDTVSVHCAYSLPAAALSLVEVWRQSVANLDLLDALSDRSQLARSYQYDEAGHKLNAVTLGPSMPPFLVCCVVRCFDR
jgi:hypothetical protein